jgi:hypothetical protein
MIMEVEPNWKISHEWNPLQKGLCYFNQFKLNYLWADLELLQVLHGSYAGEKQKMGRAHCPSADDDLVPC